MKFELKKIGSIDRAVIDLKELTILCGENNTGKTYVTYTIYGFLKMWRGLLSSAIEDEVSEILRKPLNKIDLVSHFEGKINQYFELISEEYVRRLSVVFASRSEIFKDASVKVSVSSEKKFNSEYNKSIKGAGEKIIATIRKEIDSPILEILIANETDTKEEFKIFGMVDFVVEAITDIVFAPYFADVFIASTERTGAAIFYKDLDLTQTRLLKALEQQDENKGIRRNPFHLFKAINESPYPTPVMSNIDFVRRIENIDKQTSPLTQKHPEILKMFEMVIGGTYKIIKNEGLYYRPKGTGKTHLSMPESSSSVRALLLVGFYLRCLAESGDIFMIDEPELNLHPKNQRAFARLVAQLVKCGVKVFMTTHSDYIIKELNTLIMFNSESDRTRMIKIKYGYGAEEMLEYTKVKLFMTESKKEKGENGKKKSINSLREAVICPDRGIEAQTFDDSIEEMNSIQEEILLGE